MLQTLNRNFLKITSKSVKFYGVLLLSRMANLDEVKMVWRLADAVCFDVDSTVIQEEGIDELAKFCGKGEQVEKL